MPDQLHIPLDDPELTFAEFLRFKSMQERKPSTWSKGWLAQKLERSLTQIKQYCAGHTNFPIDDLPNLHQITGDDDILTYICGRLGVHWYRLPKGLDKVEIIEAMASAMKEVGEFVQIVADAVKDHKIDKAEWLRITEEHPDAIQACAVLFHCARQMHEGE